MAFEAERDYIVVLNKKKANESLLQKLDNKILNLQKQRSALAAKIKNQEGYLERCGGGKKIKKALDIAEKMENLMQKLSGEDQSKSK